MEPVAQIDHRHVRPTVQTAQRRLQVAGEHGIVLSSVDLAGLDQAGVEQNHVPGLRCGAQCLNGTSPILVSPAHLVVEEVAIAGDDQGKKRRDHGQTAEPPGPEQDKQPRGDGRQRCQVRCQVAGAEHSHPRQPAEHEQHRGGDHIPGHQGQADPAFGRARADIERPHPKVPQPRHPEPENHGTHPDQHNPDKPHRHELAYGGDFPEDQRRAARMETPHVRDPGRHQDTPSGQTHQAPAEPAALAAAGDQMDQHLDDRQTGEQVVALRQRCVAGCPDEPPPPGRSACDSGEQPDGRVGQQDRQCIGPGDLAYRHLVGVDGGQQGGQQCQVVPAAQSPQGEEGDDRRGHARQQRREAHGQLAPAEQQELGMDEQVVQRRVRRIPETSPAHVHP